MMMNAWFAIFCSTAPLIEGSHSMEMTMNDTQEKSVALLNASQRYVNFINKISKGTLFSQIDEAAILFAFDCKKIFNGHLHTKNREEFVNDLLSVYANYGAWNMVTLEIIRAPENNCAILRFLVETESFGTNTAIVILRYDSNFLITEINEVFSPVKGAYDFKAS